ncbi:MAG: ABC transporter permease [Microbacterium sp.]|uniref:ABC transporter permease n=1 Tax=Microbacterium sp. TaxID=51671 RepID=UPI003D6E676D
MSDAVAEMELRPVRGPSALGGGGRRFFELLYLISVTEFKKTYFGTVLGYVWSLLRPLILFGVLLFVFTQIFRIGSEVTNYPVMLLFNLVLFSFFQEATNSAVTAVVNQEGIVRKTQFPRLVIPMATVLTSLLNLGMNFIAVLIFMLAYGVAITWTWIFLPLIVAVLFVLTAAVAMLLSSLYVRYRDVAIIWTVGATTLFYGTPVLYPFEIVPDEFRDILLVNPLTPLFEQARHWIIDPSAPGAVGAAGGWGPLIAPIAIAVTTCVLAVWVFNREAPRVAEEL